MPLQTLIGGTLLLAAILNVAFDWWYRFLKSVSGGRSARIDGPVARFTWRWFNSALLLFFALALLLGHLTASA